ncbi:MAG: hypothetical protein HN889_10675, partial [Rhodospirillaceae bacterium]|nr:hypothetical protein [Rhodospirillaceae bacterium]
MSAFLTLPLAILAPKGVALLFGLTAVSSFIVGLAHRQKNRGPVGPSLALAAAFILLSLSSAMWSMTPESSFKKALVLGLVLFGGLVLTFSARRLKGEARRVFEIGLIAGGVLGFGVIAIEVAFSSPILALPGTIMGRPTEQNIVLLRGINQGAAVASVFILPWTIALWRHKGVLWASAGFTVCVTVLAFCQADSHKAALVIGMAAALIAFVGGRPVLRGFSLLCVLGVLSSPWLVSALPDPLQPDNNAAVLPNSSQHRLVIWQTTAGHIFERPFFGSGFDTARAFYGPDQK